MITPSILNRISLLRYRFGSRRRRDDPLVLISFDDATLTDYTVAFPSLMSRGLKGTSYINTIHLDRNSEGRLNWTQAKEMLSAGWDIECHTHSHARLPELSDEDIRSQLEAVNSSFVAQGLSPPRHHALPFGAGFSDPRVVSIVSEYRDTIRGANSTGTYNFRRTLRLPSIRAWQLDTRSESGYNDQISAIEQGAAQGAVMGIFAHRIVSDPQADAGLLDVYFEGLLDRIVELGIESLTIKEFYERFAE